MTKNPITLAALMLALPFAAAGADSRIPAQEVWSGIYQCGAMQSDSGKFPGYSSSIRMIVEGRTATIAKQSAEVRETFSGEIAADGSLRLDGVGMRKDTSSPGWRYRFDGKIEGARFEARGMMFSANLSRRLRDCSMALTRSKAPAASEPREVAAAPVPQPKAAVPQQAPAEPASPKEPKRSAQLPGTPQTIEKELDFSRRNDSATVEGTVARGAPHRYTVTAVKGQRLNATLKSSDGARFDLYEPGSSLTTLSGGFIVQGARVGGTDDGTQVDVELPADGKYLLLVRPAREQAFYTIEVAVAPSLASSFGAAWWEHRNVWLGLGLGALVLIGVFMVRRKRDRRLFRS